MRFLQLFPVDDQRDDPRARQLVPGADGDVAVTGGDHQLVDGVDGVQTRPIHPEQPVVRGEQLDLPLAHRAAGHALVQAEGAHALGGAWTEVSSGNEHNYRFFKVTVEMP